MNATIHLGATSMIVTACDSSGQLTCYVESRVSRQHRMTQSYESIMSEIEDSYSLLIDKLQQIPSSLVLTAPVPINWEQGMARLAPGMPAIQDRSLKADVEDRLSRIGKRDLSIAIENDANAAALASYYFGKGVKSHVMVHLRLSSGLGGCILVNGKPFGGSRGLAGEIGHVVMQPSGILCGCGCIGCAETLIGGSALLSSIHRYSEANHKFDHFRDVVQAVESKDEFLEEEFKIMGRYLGLLLASVANIINPTLITLSGPLFDSRDILIQTANAEFRRRVCVGLECPIKLETFGTKAHALAGLAVHRFQMEM